MSAFADMGGLTPLRIWDGVVGRAVEGERMTLAIIELESSCSIPEHSHDNEQVGVCITGSLRFRIADETRDIGPGDTWRILGGVPHEIETGPDGALVVECFSPRRGDWSGLQRLEDGPLPRWPE